MDHARNERLTDVLLEVEGPSHAPLDRVVPLVYGELRRLAHRQLRLEQHAQTLSTTALVHEAYLRLVGGERVTARGRAYFFASAARAMRQIVVDHARRRRRLKRGGGVPAVALDETIAALDGSRVEVLDLERGLEKLAALAERPARVVECRFYGGLSIEDTALALGVTARTVKRDWAFARAWLYEYLAPPASA